MRFVKQWNMEDVNTPEVREWFCLELPGPWLRYGFHSRQGPGEGLFFFIALRVQAGSGAHTAFYHMNNGGSFPGA
jgi:hypothetical protein